MSSSASIGVVQLFAKYFKALCTNLRTVPYSGCTILHAHARTSAWSPIWLLVLVGIPNNPAYT